MEAKKKFDFESTIYSVANMAFDSKKRMLR